MVGTTNHYHLKMASKKKGTKKPFRVDAKSVFLTYPLCTMTKEETLACYTDVLMLPIVEYTICEEKHESGDPHIHAWLKFEKRVNAHHAGYYDLTDSQGKVWHGNYAAARSDVKCRKYCEKEGNWISTKEITPLARAVMAAEKGNVKEAFDIVAGARPDMVLNGAGRVMASIRELAANAESEDEQEVFVFKNVPGTLAEWNRKLWTLWLLGPSGYGKTELALSLFKNALLVSHMDQLKDLRPEHDGIVFDDVSVAHWPRESVIHITDLAKKRGINVKHGCVVIPKHLPRVFCSNVWIWPEDEPGSIERRVHCVRVTKRLFDEESIAAKPAGDWKQAKQDMLVSVDDRLMGFA